MKNRVFFLICFFLFFIGKGCSKDYLLTTLPMYICIEQKSLDGFFSEFDLHAINKIEFKVINMREEKLDTIKAIKEGKKIKRILSELNKLRCTELTLSATTYELWFYENEILRMKLALAIDPKITIVRVYRPDQLPGWDSPLNHSDFVIENEEFCSWLLNEFGDVHEYMIPKSLRETT